MPDGQCRPQREPWIYGWKNRVITDWGIQAESLIHRLYPAVYCSFLLPACCGAASALESWGCGMPLQPRKAVSNLTPGVHGGYDKAELETLGIEPDEIIDFSVSTNPAGIPPGILRQ